MRRHPMDYSRAKTRREVLIRQRREIWTPEQVESLVRHFRLKPGMKLLDAGCGFGYAMRTWGRFCLPGGKLTGLDRDKKLLAQAARFCKKEGLGKAARFVTGDISKMPFEDSVFDVALAHVVFCHLAEPEKALDEMIRVTRPGGCVAVFDNAITAGSASSRWNNWHEPTIDEHLLMYEVGLRMADGRRIVGFGDWSVGCHVPAWMEARGMKDVGVRTNERVVWIAPPYRSPEQRVPYQNTRERLKEPSRFRLSKGEADQMRAGGLTRARFNRHRRITRRSMLAFRRAMKKRTAAYAWSSPFWCIWGFKP